MKKKLKKLLVPVIALTCVATGGVLTACGDNGGEEQHTHSYTQWAHDEEQHWKVCPDDGAIDESTREDHIFVAGECECGAEESGIDPEPAEYGSATGQVRLHKLGEYVDDYSGVTIDLGDDNVDIEYDSTTGEYTLSNLVAGKQYMLTISKVGYNNYSIPVQVAADQTVAIGGTAGSVLEYAAFMSAVGWNSPVYSRVNDENPLIGTSSNTLAEQTVDGYDAVAATLTVNRSFTTNAEGIWMFFEDGKIMSVAIYDNTTAIEWDGTNYANDWGTGENITLSATGDRWYLADGNGDPCYTSTSVPADIVAKHEAGTLDVTLVRDGARFYVFVDGKFADTVTVDEKYADDKVQVGFWAKDAVMQPDGTYPMWPFRIESDVSAYLKDVDVELGEMQNGKATAEQTQYRVGDTVRITFEGDEGYAAQNVSVNGKDVTSELNRGVLSFRAEEGGIYKIEATFVKTEAPVAFAAEVAVADTDGSVDAEGKTVQLLGQTNDYVFTVADGKIGGEVVPGIYTVKIDGYYAQEVTVSVDGYSGSFVFEEEIAAEGQSGWKAIRGDEEVTTEGLTFMLSQANSQTTLFQQGIVYRFENGDWIYVRIEFYGTSGYFQFAWDDPINASMGGAAIKADWAKPGGLNGASGDLTAAECEQFKQGTLGMTLLRHENKLYIFRGDICLQILTLDAKYADMDGAAYVAVQTASGIPVDYEYLDEQTVLGIVGKEYSVTVTVAEGAEYGTAAAVTGKAVYGEQVVVSIEPQEGYACTEITANGKDVYDTYNATTGEWVYNITEDIELKVTFRKTFVTDIQTITDNKTNIDLTASVGDLDSLAFEMFRQNADWFELVPNDPYDLIDISAAGSNVNGCAHDFNAHGWTVVWGDTLGNAPCITNTFDMPLRLVKGVSQIRLFVGGWWMENHGGSFTLCDESGAVYASMVYRSRGEADDPNDIIVFNLDTSEWADGEIRDFILRFSGVGFNQLPFAGLQLLGATEAVDAALHSVSISFQDDAAHGYTAYVDHTGFATNGTVVLTIETSDAAAAWSFFPASITVNGEEMFDKAERESLGANRCRYTLTITGGAEDMDIVITVGTGTPVSYSASVEDETGGTVVCDMENAGKVYYWNDLCTLTITAQAGYRLEKIVLGETEVTEGWTSTTNEDGTTVYIYAFTVTGDITATVHFAANA